MFCSFMHVCAGLLLTLGLPGLPGVVWSVLVCVGLCRFVNVCVGFVGLCRFKHIRASL